MLIIIVLIVDGSQERVAQVVRKIVNFDDHVDVNK